MQYQMSSGNSVEVEVKMQHRPHRKVVFVNRWTWEPDDEDHNELLDTVLDTVRPDAPMEMTDHFEQVKRYKLETFRHESPGGNRCKALLHLAKDGKYLFRGHWDRTPTTEEVHGLAEAIANFLHRFSEEAVII